MVFKCDAFIHGHIILNFDSIAHGNTGTDDDILPDLAVLPDARSCENMGRVPNTRSLTDVHAFVNEGRFMGKVSSIWLWGRCCPARTGLLFQRFLASLQHGQYSQPFRPVRSRLGARCHAVKEVLTFSS